MNLRPSRVLAALVLASVVGCGSSAARDGFGEDDVSPTDPKGDGNGNGSSSGFGGDSSAGLSLVPKNTTVVIDLATKPATAGKVTFKVVQKTQGGDKDVTAGAKFTLKDASLGSINGATFTSVDALPQGVLGKSTYVTAETSAGSAMGTLTVVGLRKTGEQRDFFFVVPYKDAPSPKSDTLKFSTTIKQADVAILMDSTASMSGSITNLKTALQTTLLAQLQAAIPNVGIAIVDHKDFPISPYGEGGDFPVKVLQRITTSLPSAQAAVNLLKASGGNDLPESQIPAMQHILTGGAVTWSGGSVPAYTAPAGTWGGVDFRNGAVPVVVLITDIDWHGEGHSPYNFATTTMAQLKQTFVAKSAKFVNVTSGDESQANELSDASSSNVPSGAFGGVANCAPNQCCTDVNGAGRAPNGPAGNCRLNFKHSGGNGVSAGVVKAIEAIAVGSTFDVTAKPSNDPKNAKNVDATKFIKALRAMDEGDAAAGCPKGTAKDTNGDGIKDTFVAVKVGTPVCFEVIPNENTLVEPDLDPQFFNAFIDVIGVQGNVQLDRRAVLFLVPPKDAGVK